MRFEVKMSASSQDRVGLVPSLMVADALEIFVQDAQKTHAQKTKVVERKLYLPSFLRVLCVREMEEMNNSRQMKTWEGRRDGMKEVAALSLSMCAVRSR